MIHVETTNAFVADCQKCGWRGRKQVTLLRALSDSDDHEIICKGAK